MVNARRIVYCESTQVDLAQLAALRVSAGWAPVDTATLAAQLAGSAWAITAWDSARLVGFVRAISDRISNGYICGLVVDRVYRGLHVGSELMARLLSAPERSRIRWVLRADPAVHDFYLKMGFHLAEDLLRRDRAVELTSTSNSEIPKEV